MAPKKAEDAAKRKAEEAVETEPAAKEARTEAQEPAEKETDAPKQSGKLISQDVEFYNRDITLNVVPTLDGKMLTSLTDGGMQYLIAGTRANVGVKAGRYIFEIRIVEALTRVDGAAARWDKGPAPRQLVRIGVGTEGSHLILGQSEDQVFFDSEGNFTACQKKELNKSKKLTRDQVVSVLLNLDPESPNKNTLSMFVDGQRASKPQAIPETLLGKPLFPMISFRNVTLQANFGPALLRELPFKCHMIGCATVKDATVLPKAEPKDGKYEVVFPVGYPDEGTFDWADQYLAANPHLVELSDRKIHEWAAASGLVRPRTRGITPTNDRPEFNYGLPGMDDLSIRRILQSVSGLLPRHYFIMEVKANLVEAERGVAIKRFSSSKFKKIAHVVLGEPSDSFKQLTYDGLLKLKQEKADNAWRQKKAERERKKIIDKRARDIAEARRKAEAKKKAAEAEAKKKEEAKMEVDEDGKEAKKEDEEVKKEDAEEMKEEAKEETKEEEKEEKQDADMEAEEDDLGDEPPKVELTDEEKQVWFREKAQKDLHPKHFDANFARFSIPEKSEGFDVVRFEWAKEDDAKAYLRQKVVAKKRCTRIENLSPGQWFQDKRKEWSNRFSELQEKQDSFKSASKTDKKPEDKDEAAKVETTDVLAVEDICDLGNGAPLFKDFLFEDWALLQLRYELWLLQVAWQKDVNDPDRGGITETHASFYYNRYFKKQLNPRHWGAETFTDATKLIKDTIAWNDEGMTSELEGDEVTFDHFVKLAEESRRERQRRIDIGDESARLKIQLAAMTGGFASQADHAPSRESRAGGDRGPVVGGSHLSTPMRTFAAPLVGRPGFKGAGRGGIGKGQQKRSF